METRTTWKLDSDTEYLKSLSENRDVLFKRQNRLARDQLTRDRGNIDPLTRSDISRHPGDRLTHLLERNGDGCRPVDAQPSRHLGRLVERNKGQIIWNLQIMPVNRQPLYPVRSGATRDYRRGLGPLEIKR